MKRYIVGALLAVLWTLAPGLDNGAQAQHTKAGTSARTSESRIHVTFQGGKLSVDLENADLREVLGVIGRQAAIEVSLELRASQQLTLRFTDLELETGLRRLLTASALPHAILFTEGPGGGLSIKGIRIFGAPAASQQTSQSGSGKAENGRGAPEPASPRASSHPADTQAPPGASAGGPVALPLPPGGAERGVTQTLPPAPGAWSSGRRGPARSAPSLKIIPAHQSETGRRFREALERTQHEPPVGADSEAARRFREALERARLVPVQLDRAN